MDGGHAENAGAFFGHADEVPGIPAITCPATAVCACKILNTSAERGNQAKFCAHFGAGFMTIQCGSGFYS
jgi:hypothetical protein